MFRFVCLSLFLSSSTSLHKPASQWDSRLGSLTSRSSWFSSWTQSQLLFRLKIWTMRNVKLTACSNNFSLSTSLRNLKLESSHHQSASLHHLDSCSYFLPQSWVSSLYECLRTIPYTHTRHYTANANPRMYENTTLFFGDIVGFTKLTAQRWKRLCVLRCWSLSHVVAALPPKQSNSWTISTISLTKPLTTMMFTRYGKQQKMTTTCFI